MMVYVYSNPFETMGIPVQFIPFLAEAGKVYQGIMLVLLWSLYVYLFFQGNAQTWYGWIVLVLAVIFTVSFLMLSASKKEMNRTGVSNSMARSSSTL